MLGPQVWLLHVDKGEATTEDGRAVREIEVVGIFSTRGAGINACTSPDECLSGPWPLDISLPLESPDAEMVQQGWSDFEELWPFVPEEEE